MNLLKNLILGGIALMSTSVFSAGTYYCSRPRRD